MGKLSPTESLPCPKYSSLIWSCHVSCFSFLFLCGPTTRPYHCGLTAESSTWGPHPPSKVVVSSRHSLQEACQSRTVTLVSSFIPEPQELLKSSLEDIHQQSFTSAMWEPVRSAIQNGSLTQRQAVVSDPLESQICHIPAMWPVVRHFTSLILTFPISKMETLVPLWEGCHKDTMGEGYKALSTMFSTQLVHEKW